MDLFFNGHTEKPKLNGTSKIIKITNYELEEKPPLSLLEGYTSLKAVTFSSSLSMLKKLSNLGYREISLIISLPEDFEETKELKLLSFLKDEGEKITKTFKKEVELVLPQELSYVEPNNKFFPVPKLAFLLPVSAQAKAIYLYLHYLKDRENPAVRVSAKRIGETLRIDRKKVNEYLKQLESINAVSFKKNNSLEILIKSPLHWNTEAFLKIQETYGKHPFLKEWEIDKEKSSNTPHSKVPIDPTSKSEKERDTKTKDFPTTSITTSKKNTTSIYDANNIYNGVGVKKCFNFSAKSFENLNKEGNASLKETNANSKENASSTYKSATYVANNKVSSKSKVANGEKFAKTDKVQTRVNQEELGKIKEALRSVMPVLKERYPRWFEKEALEFFERLYFGLKKVYGEDWLTLAVMYELFNRKASRYGYSREVNKNYLGLLISFAYKDSQASFWEFFKRFCKVFDIKPTKTTEKQEEQKAEKQESSKEITLESLKEYLKSKLAGKQTVYRIFVEEGMKDLKKDDNSWAVICKDSIVRDYAEKNFAVWLREFLRAEIKFEV